MKDNVTDISNSPLRKEIDQKSERKVYIDWNVLSMMQDSSEISDPEISRYIQLLKYIFEDHSSSYLIPYSDAHLRDIGKANKPGNEDRIDARLKYLSNISNNTCIVQYADNSQTVFQKLEPRVFFNELFDKDGEEEYDSWDDLIQSLSEFGLEKSFEVFKSIPHNIDFKALKPRPPMVEMMFNRALSENSMYAVMSDVFSLNKLIHSDPLFYREFRSQLRELLKLDPNLSNAFDGIGAVNKSLQGTDLNLSFDDMLNLSDDKTSKNERYSIFLKSFMQLDIMGYSPDTMSKRNTYLNLFYDGMHAYYAGYCKFYLSFDNKSVKKANAVYTNMNIGARAILVPEFCQILEEEYGPVK